MLCAAPLLFAAAGLAFAGESQLRQCGNRLRPAANGGQDHVPPYFCPLAGGSQAASECCDPKPPSKTCCEAPEILSFSQPWQTAVAAICVGVAGLLVTLVLGFCAWSDQCPLHGLCQKEAKADYIAKPGDAFADGGEGCALMMPSENAKNVRVFVPTQETTPPNMV